VILSSRCLQVRVLLITRLNESELFLPSFHVQYGYRHKLCAADVVRACEALLESIVCILSFYTSCARLGT